MAVESGDRVLPAQPERPPFSSSLPDIERVPRPLLAPAAVLLVVGGLAVHVWLAVRAIADLAGIRAELAEQLAEEAPDFSEDDVDRAVTVLLAAANGLAVALAVVLLLGCWTFLRRSAGGRFVMMTATILLVPLLGVASVLRMDDERDFRWMIGGIAALVLAQVLARLTPVNRWLRQIERRPRISMDPYSGVETEQPAPAASPRRDD